MAELCLLLQKIGFPNQRSVTPTVSEGFPDLGADLVGFYCGCIWGQVQELHRTLNKPPGLALNNPRVICQPHREKL